VAETVENPWWPEGRRLLRAGLADFLTRRRRRTLSMTAVVALVVSIPAALWMAGVFELTPGIRVFSFVLLMVLVLVGLVLGIVLAVASRQVRADAPTGTRFPWSSAPIFDLSTPLTGVTAADRRIAEDAIDRQRRSLPVVVLGTALIASAFALAIIAIIITGQAPAITPFWMIYVALNYSIMIGTLKTLGSTTSVLRRLDETGEPPTYLGPKGWGIEAPRNPPESDGASG
jgi:hypothetical protein